MYIDRLPLLFLNIETLKKVYTCSTNNKYAFAENQFLRLNYMYGIFYFSLCSFNLYMNIALMLYLSVQTLFSDLGYMSEICLASKEKKYVRKD